MMKQTRRMMLDKGGAQEAVNNYMSSLADLTVNSKPHINALTFLAEDYLNYAEAIVKAVDDHLQKVPSNVKLPILYLIDSIIKNVGKDYVALFSSTMVHSFSTVFKQVDEKTRQQMYKLRVTWKDIYPQEDLYAMDIAVHALDPQWPITAAPPPPAPAPLAPHKIHINPKFLQTSTVAAPMIGSPVSPVVTPEPSPVESSNNVVSQAAPSKAAVDVATEVALREQLLQRKRDLLQLQQEKVDLELSQMKAKLDKKQKAVSKLNDKTTSENLPIVAPTTEKTMMPTVPSRSEDDVVMVKEVRSSSWEGRKAFKLDKLSQKDNISILPNSAQTSVPPSTIKIAPVRSELVNLVASQRAQRDPRLSKQVKEEVIKEESSKPQSRNKDPRLGIKPEKRSRSSEKETLKSSRRRSRDVSSDRSSSRHSSRREDREKRSSDNRKSNRKSEDRSSSRLKKTSSHSPSKSLSKRDRRDSNRSPRKTSYTSHRPVSDCVDSPESDASDSKDGAVSPTSPHTSTASASGSASWPVNYIKGSHKGRNYVRKNIQEESPEVVSSSVSSDVDLRPSAPPEKQLRLTNPSERLHQSSSSTLSPGVPEQILPTIARQDVDLRYFPSSPGKKRRSAEPEDGPPPNKKNKAGYIEMLFGKEDVDLRRQDLKNGVPTDAPSPPPPPVISSLEGQTPLKDNSLGWSKFKQSLTPSPTVERSPAFPRSSRHDRLGLSAGENEQSQNEDTDMRLPINGLEPSSRTADIPAILATAAEQVKNGTMSHDDYVRMQKQLFRSYETEKILEAQRNDFTRRDSWERRPREKDYRHGMRSPDNEQFGDIDERYPAPRPVKKTLLPLPMVPPVHQDGMRLPRHMGQRMPGPMPGPGYMRPQRPLLGPGPRGLMRGSWRAPRYGPGFKDNPISIPPADSFILDKIAQDSMRIINIDGVGREIRFYGNDAVAILAADNPREIAFDPGDASIIVNDVVVHCSFHKSAKEVNISGKMYRVRLGAPTREIYINDEGFECQFNSPPKEVHLATGEVLQVQLQTDTPPKVHVGNQRRDLVAGRVMLIIDAEITVPIFLDAKPQRFDIEGVPHIIKFADALETILVNNHPFTIQFGGHPVPVTVNNRRHYIRLTELPQGVVPGEVEIVSMSHYRTKAPSTRPGVSSVVGAATPWGSKSQTPQIGQQVEMDVDHEPALPMHEPALPVRGGLGLLTRGMPKKIMKPRIPRRDREPTESLRPARSEDRQMPAELLQAIQPGLPVLVGLLPSSNSSGYSTPLSGSGAYSMRQGAGYGVGAGPTTSSLATASADSSATPASASASEPSATSSSSNGIPFLAPELDIQKLYQSLYDTGIISAISSIKDSKKDKAKEEEENKKKVHEVDFKEVSSTFKVKQPALIDILYSGIQCSSCGTRFPPEQTEKYSSHLDWHFRQNRRDKDSARKPQSRKWYYDVSDWIQFEEIDETVDKTQNWFDTQQMDAAKFEEAEEEEIQSVPSNDFPDGTVCELCHDKFDQFYNEDKEEWHLKDCVVADSLPYHPFCYKDYRVSLESNEESEEPSEAAESVEAAKAAESVEAVKAADSVETAESEEAGQSVEAAETVKAVETVKAAEPMEAESAEADEAVADSTDDVKSATEELKIPVDKIKKESEEGLKEESVTSEEVKMETEEKDHGSEETEVKQENNPEEEKEESSTSVSCKQEETGDTADMSIVKGPEGDEEETLKENPSIKEEVDEPEDLPAPAGTVDELSEVKPQEEAPVNVPITNTNSAIVSCSIDGNLELAQAPAALPSLPNRIKINISKPIFVKPIVESGDESDDASESGEEPASSEPAPPGEDKTILKPKLVGRKLCELPPRVRGNETSGLCSIM